MEGLKKGILVRNGVCVGAVGDKYFSNAPIGVIQAFSGQTAPHGYLLCNGTSYKVADYPDLYAVIGNIYGGDTENFNVPDYRETVLVGVGENTTDTIADHDVYELGEFKDDQFQGHEHNTYKNYESNATGGSGGDTSYGGIVQTPGIVSDGTNGEPRKSTTTHGKQKGVTYIIKAFHTNEGVDSGVSDDVVEYVNDSLVDKADKSYVDDNFATMDKVGNAQIIGFKTNRLNQCYGYYTIGNNKVSVHMKFVLSRALNDWETLTNVNLPVPSSAVTKNANGKTGASNSVYISTEGSMQQGGGGGMSAGTYEFDFEYTTA